MGRGMINKVKKFFIRLLAELIFFLKYRRYLSVNETANQKLLQYKFLSAEHRGELFDYGFSAFSQHEEDGILLYIFSLIGTTNKKCLEICMGNGVESNTANLIVNHFWVGLLFDGCAKNVEVARIFYSLHKNTRIYPPKIINAWITKEPL
jgi:hypothetical protein